ncbi:MAG: ATP-binding protein [Azospirillaceae bacterium]|nr:ATP-binding protein [Azospirillaceae bacterium]
MGRFKRGSQHLGHPPGGGPRASAFPLTINRIAAQAGARIDLLESLSRRADSMPRPRLIQLGQLILMALNHQDDSWMVPILTTVVALNCAAWAPWPAVATWMTLSLIALVLSQWTYRRFLGQVDRLGDPHRWNWRLTGARLALPVTWSLLPLFAWPVDATSRSFLVLVLSTAMALRVGGITPHRLALKLQLVPPALALLVLVATAQGPMPRPAMVVGCLLYPVFLYRMGRQSWLRTRRMLELHVDLTAAKRAADEANRAKSGYLATLSHEIRTPMTGILGLTRLLLDTGLSMRQRDYVRTVHESGESLLAILNDVLDLSKVEAGRLEVEATAFDPVALLDGVRDLMAGRAAEKGLDLQVRLSPDFPSRLTGDPLRLRQVLLNLVGNAIKFTERGWVRISASADRTPEGDLRFGVIVSDTGVGVPEAAQDRLFETFSQASVEVTRRYGGSGLGLAIAKRLVEAMDGEIGFQSQPGDGSHFWFAVPSSVPEAAAVAVASGEAVPELPALAVLVVEDVTANQVVLDALLRTRGHRVTLVADGAAAVRVVARGRFDLVLMDMQLPGIDGLEAARRIRALPDATRAAVPIVATTANGDVADAARCQAAGMDGFVTKPIRPEALLDAMRGAWAARGGTVWPEEPAGDTALLDTRQMESVAQAIGRRDLPEFITITVQTLVETAERFLDMANGGDITAAGHAAHTLCGVAANVGLAALSADARRAQQSLRDDPPEIQRALAVRLRDSTATAADTLSAWLRDWLGALPPETETGSAVA